MLEGKSCEMIDKAEGKVADIEQHIDRLESWISKDEAQFSSFD